MMKSFCAYVPTNIMFGSGMVKELHKQQMPGKKAMIVTSNGKSTKPTAILTPLRPN